MGCRLFGREDCDLHDAASYHGPGRKPTYLTPEAKKMAKKKRDYKAMDRYGGAAVIRRKQLINAKVSLSFHFHGQILISRYQKETIPGQPNPPLKWNLDWNKQHGLKVAPVRPALLMEELGTTGSEWEEPIATLTSEAHPYPPTEKPLIEIFTLTKPEEITNFFDVYVYDSRMFMADFINAGLTV